MPDQIISSYMPLLVYELTNNLSRYLERQKSFQVIFLRIELLSDKAARLNKKLGNEDLKIIREIRPINSLK